MQDADEVAAGCCAASKNMLRFRSAFACVTTLQERLIGQLTTAQLVCCWEIATFKLFQLIFGPVGLGQNNMYYRQLVISLVAEYGRLLPHELLLASTATAAGETSVLQRQRHSANRANHRGLLGNPWGCRDRQEWSQQVWVL